MLQISQAPSPNYGERRDDKTANMLVLHYTDMLSAEAALKRMCDPATEVSAHYLIDEAGKIYQLVEEDKRAWHAGVSFWDGETDINSCSIGIELANPGHSHGLKPFPEVQIESLIELANDICKRHNIEAARVIGHSDIAPGRKVDPGPLFPWQRLSEHGLGLWPEPSQIEDFAISDAEFSIANSLEKIGYDVTDTKEALAAFQLHYRPSNYDGVIDDETKSLLLSMNKK